MRTRADVCTHRTRDRDFPANANSLLARSRSPARSPQLSRRPLRSAPFRRSVPASASVSHAWSWMYTRSRAGFAVDWPTCQFPIARRPARKLSQRNKSLESLAKGSRKEGRGTRREIRRTIENRSPILCPQDFSKKNKNIVESLQRQRSEIESWTLLSMAAWVRDRFKSRTASRVVMWRTQARTAHKIASPPLAVAASRVSTLLRKYGARILGLHCVCIRRA